MRRIWLLLPVLLRAASAGEVSQDIDRITKRQGFSGAVLVAKAGKVIYSKGHGYANHEWQTLNTPETRFPIASITKTFTALSILQLIERGKCNLGDEVRKHYSSIPEHWKEITIEHLLRHRSGISAHNNPGEYKKTTTQPYVPEELVAEFASKPLLFPPGTQFSYSNPGYHLLGLLVQRISGVSYEQYIKDEILLRSGMTSTGIDSFTKVVRTRADGYVGTGGNIERAPYWDRSLAFATGSLYSTTMDLFRYITALRSGKLLGLEYMNAMFTPDNGSMGLGWFIRTSKDGNRFYEHTGGNPGVTSIVRIYPTDELVIIALSNFENTKATKLAEGISQVMTTFDTSPLQSK